MVLNSSIYDKLELNEIIVSDTLLKNSVLLCQWIIFMNYQLIIVGVYYFPGNIL